MLNCDEVRESLKPMLRKTLKLSDLDFMVMIDPALPDFGFVHSECLSAVSSALDQVRSTLLSTDSALGRHFGFVRQFYQDAQDAASRDGGEINAMLDSATAAVRSQIEAAFATDGLPNPELPLAELNAELRRLSSESHGLCAQVCARHDIEIHASTSAKDRTVECRLLPHRSWIYKSRNDSCDFADNRCPYNNNNENNRCPFHCGLG